MGPKVVVGSWDLGAALWELSWGPSLWFLPHPRHWPKSGHKEPSCFSGVLFWTLPMQFSLPGMPFPASVRSLWLILQCLLLPDLVSRITCGGFPRHLECASVSTYHIPLPLLEQLPPPADGGSFKTRSKSSCSVPPEHSHCSNTFSVQWKASHPPWPRSRQPFPDGGLSFWIRNTYLSSRNVADHAAFPSFFLRNLNSCICKGCKLWSAQFPCLCVRARRSLHNQEETWESSMDLQKQCQKD